MESWSKEDWSDRYDGGESQSPGGDNHYRQGGIEPVDFILSNNLPAWKALAIKYIFRAGYKCDTNADTMEEQMEAAALSEVQDVEKAIWWLQKHLEQLETE